MPRPFELDPLFRAVTALPGIGPRNGALLEKLIDGPKIFDLLCHMPIDAVDRTHTPKIAETIAGDIATIAVDIISHSPAPKRNLPHRISCRDETGVMDLIFFHANGQWLKKQLPDGAQAVVSGKVEHYNGKVQIIHPEYIRAPDNAETKSSTTRSADNGAQDKMADIARIDPIYPLTSGITNKLLTKTIRHALNHIHDLPEWIDPQMMKKHHFPDWIDALENTHNPLNMNDISPLSKNRERLAYDELLANQLALALVRLRQKKQSGHALPSNNTMSNNTMSDNTIRQKFLDQLPFSLTGAQQRCLHDIDTDMASNDRMMRLVQGDVGSGKTVVAGMAMLSAIENGFQAALMAPTEILARQHAQSLGDLFDAIGLRCVTLTGRDKGKSRDEILAQIASGQAQIIFGTHALFQKDVAFHRLGLAVIDEQHRFGVHQRMELSAKGEYNGAQADILVMTATPIPRTLALTAYGDLEISRIDEKPPGRKPVDTLVMHKDKIPDIIHSLPSKIAQGSRIYWVCPLVEESDILDVSAAQERFEILDHLFPGRVGLVHGKLKPRDKDDVMNRFASGQLDILVATTVIEVGVNVPEATIMIIEHAERFGLAQLHQLRGRVGRGQDKSFCFLIHNGKLSETGKERLRIMRESEDGFLIAEKDLKLRGGGEVLGTRQSGLPEFKLADMTHHDELLYIARDDAKLILHQDPHLTSPRGQALKTLLYLFERDQAITYLQSG